MVFDDRCSRHWVVARVAFVGYGVGLVPSVAELVLADIVIDGALRLATHGRFPNAVGQCYARTNEAPGVRSFDNERRGATDHRLAATATFFSKMM